MKIAKGIKFINVNNMKYLLCFFIFLIFEGLNAQTDTNNKESDLFYKEDNSENNTDSRTNNTTLQTKKYNFEKSNFSDFIDNNKPIFLTGKSSNPLKKSDYYDDDNLELCYNSIYEVEKYSNELRKIPLTERDVLYFSRVINDVVIEAKSNSRTYYVYKVAFDYNQVSSTLIELNDDFLIPVNLYFSNFKNNTSIQQSVRCYAKSRLDDYNWKSEFDKEDYVNLVTNKILNNLKSIIGQNGNSYYKIYEGIFGSYNFENNTYNVDLSQQIGVSDFFKNDFDNRIFYKGDRNYNNYVQESIEFKCNPTIARQIADLFDSERKLNIRLELIPSSSNTNLCVCGGFYENNFMIKSLVISRDNNFNESNSVRIYF
jgi:hypothetical protein